MNEHFVTDFVRVNQETLYYSLMLHLNTKCF